MARQVVNEVTDGLATKSAKIRALADAGYDRTEIAKVLGIRYQHVRKVLIDSGNTGGLRRQVDVEREPITVDVAPVSSALISCDALLKAGFRFLGEWTLDSDGAIKPNATAPAEPGVYAFAIGDIAVYIGLTNSGLRTRFDQYRRGHKGQRTSARVKGLIVKALSGGEQVEILIATPPASEWNGLPVNTAAGLEGGLIQMMRPAWNILGAV
jgi:hypothetical protein